MGAHSHYRCDKCEYTADTTISGRMYAISNDGRRVPCLHPCEDTDAERATGMTWKEAQAANRIGVEDAMVCRAWGEVTWLDRSDPQQCSSCNSADVVGVHAMIGQACPMCKTGVITETWFAIS